MPEQYEHLQLPKIDIEYDRKKFGRGGYKIVEGREKDIFYETQIKTFQNLTLDQSNLKKRYIRYFDPSLIFKLEINQKVDEESSVMNYLGWISK